MNAWFCLYLFTRPFLPSFLFFFFFRPHVYQFSVVAPGIDCRIIIHYWAWFSFKEELWTISALVYQVGYKGFNIFFSVQSFLHTCQIAHLSTYRTFLPLCTVLAHLPITLIPDCTPAVPVCHPHYLLTNSPFSSLATSLLPQLCPDFDNFRSLFPFVSTHNIGWPVVFVSAFSLCARVFACVNVCVSFMSLCFMFVWARVCLCIILSYTPHHCVFSHLRFFPSSQKKQKGNKANASASVR